MKNNLIKNGFTLSEVLVTLGIIGVIAAMTLPSLIAKHQEKETIARLKQTYSLLQQAMLLAKNDYGDMDNWSNGTTVYKISDDVALVLSKYMNVEKICLSYDHSECFAKEYSSLTRIYNGIKVNDYARIVLNNGTSIRIYILTLEGSNFCGNFYVDINGKKKPNTIGKDFFSFRVFKDKIVPYGSEQQADSSNYMLRYCNLDSTDSANGEGCAGWVLTNENMDYLHCGGLSWNGKTSCKSK